MMLEWLGGVPWQIWVFVAGVMACGMLSGFLRGLGDVLERAADLASGVVVGEVNQGDVVRAGDADAQVGAARDTGAGVQHRTKCKGGVERGTQEDRGVAGVELARGR